MRGYFPWVCSVRYYRGLPAVKYRRYTCTERIRYVRSGVLYRTDNFGTFGLEFYTLPNISVRSARCPYPYRRYRYDTPYRYREARYVRYDAHTGTENFGTFGTMSIPLPRTSVRSVPCPYRTGGIGMTQRTDTELIPYREYRSRANREVRLGTTRCRYSTATHIARSSTAAQQRTLPHRYSGPHEHHNTPPQQQRQCYEFFLSLSCLAGG